MGNFEPLKPSNRHEHLISKNEDSYIVEIKKGLASTRDFRAAMLSMAMTLNSEDSQAIFTLVLLQPEMAMETIEDEWSKFYHTINLDLRSRLELLVYDESGLVRVTADANAYNLRNLPMSEIMEIVELKSKPLNREAKLPQPDIFHVITTLLIKNLFTRNKFLKTKELEELSGFSYPSARRVIEKLDPWLERDSSRSLRLRYFPTDIWWKLLSNAEDARHTVYFRDVSNLARGNSGLLSRFRKLDFPDIAVGGVTASLAHFPGLDILGSPRLDLIVHQPYRPSPDEEKSLSPKISMEAEVIASKIDSSLQLTTNPKDPIKLAIHYIRHKPSYFTYDQELAMLIADEVECLFDLHGARLTPQAEQFLNHLKHKIDS